MTTDRLQRSPNQALYRYMPDQPYSWATPRYRGGAIGINPNATTDLDVAEEWLKPLPGTADRAVRRSTACLPQLPIRDLIDKEQYRLVTPLDLRATRFPNTFHCSRCDYFRRVDATGTRESAQVAGSSLSSSTGCTPTPAGRSPRSPRR